MAAKGETKSKAIVEGKSLLQLYGFNGFTLQDLADALSIRKPSLYEHFDSKESLGCALIAQYRREFEEATAGLETQDPEQRIIFLFKLLYHFAKDQGKYCPLQILTAELFTLPDSIRAEVKAMADSQYSWVDKAIADGQEQGVFRTDRSCQDLTESVIAMAMGSHFMARVNEQPKLIITLSESCLSHLRAQVR